VTVRVRAPAPANFLVGARAHPTWAVTWEFLASLSLSCVPFSMAVNSQWSVRAALLFSCFFCVNSSVCCNFRRALLLGVCARAREEQMRRRVL